MLRSNLALLAALSLTVALVGCTQCDTCDDFPLPCNGPNCGFQGAPVEYGSYGAAGPVGADVALAPPPGAVMAPVAPVATMQPMPVAQPAPGPALAVDSAPFTQPVVDSAPAAPVNPPAEISPPPPTSASVDTPPRG